MGFVTLNISLSLINYFSYQHLTLNITLAFYHYLCLNMLKFSHTDLFLSEVLSHRPLLVWSSLTKTSSCCKHFVWTLLLVRVVFKPFYSHFLDIYMIYYMLLIVLNRSILCENEWISWRDCWYWSMSYSNIIRMFIITRFTRDDATMEFR